MHIKKTISKFHSLLTMLNSTWQKKLVHDLTRASHNSYSITNIEQLNFIYKFLKTYASDILFCSSCRIEHNGENGI
jgi:hypothetical protein